MKQPTQSSGCSKKKRLLFIDRDDTLIIEPEDEQIDSLEKLEYLPGVFRALGDIARYTDFELVIVTNQDGLGTASFPEATFWPAQNKMISAFEKEGIRFSNVLIDCSLPRDNSPNRKPGIGMLGDYQNAEYDLGASFVIGDRLTDVELAANLGTRAILIGKKWQEPEFRDKLEGKPISLIASRWSEISDFLVFNPRRAAYSRKTSETEINVSLVLDGSGRASIKTGLGFFDHMLEQIARHSGCDIDIFVTGDLHVDEHHTIEDTALVLGEVFNQALGDKVGVERYGFFLPMDDSAAQVALDFSGRPWLVWDVEFAREKIGDVPTEMFYHFFKSFCDTARCNLFISASGSNEHHKIEAVFKAFARSIKMAKHRDILAKGNIPSTKGVL